jgi:hypothetical protein
MSETNDNEEENREQNRKTRKGREEKITISNGVSA